MTRLALLFILAYVLFSLCEAALRPIAFVSTNQGRDGPLMLFTTRISALFMAKASKKKKKGGRGGGGAAGGIKGFGSTAPSSSTASKKKSVAVMDRSKEAMAFYDYMEENGAGDNLKRVALGQFPLPGTTSTLRGVMALKDMKKSDVIIRIPYEMAINLGQEGGDPTLPGVELLQQYCRILTGKADDTESDRSTYFKTLPEFMGTDCMGSTDFFSEKALESLQSPLVVEETLQRRERTKKRFDQDVASNDAFPTWIDGTAVTEQHLQWAVWLITSRVLTVQGDANEGKSYRLLIPFLDMCNHDRNSPHVLSGRAVPGGELKVVAGAPVQAGEQVNICYGGGVAGNDRFLQDYGFADLVLGYNIVAQQLIGKRKILEGDNAGRTLSLEDQERALDALRSTTMLQDEELLAQETEPDLRSATEYRLAVKKALSGYIVMQ